MTPRATATLPSLASARVCGEESTDPELVAAVRDGDDRAFEQLYGRYHRRIGAYVAGMVRDHGRAEDITQEVFLSALRRMRETERPIAFKPWIYEIAKNACIDQFRRTRRTEEVSYDAGEDSGSDYGAGLTCGSTPEAAVDDKVALDNLCGAFGGLSETHHQILVMRELEGLSYSQIGERLGMSRPAVESTLFRARRRLAAEYDELVSGERCRRVQSIIAGAVDIAPGARDRRRVAVHVSHCQPCRRHARAAGLDVGTLTAGAVRRARVAALLPLPAFLRRRSSSVDLSSAAGAGHTGTLAQWSAQAGSAFDPAVVSWVKAATAAATVAVVGVGAGHAGSEATRHAPRPVVAATPPAAQHAQPRKASAPPAVASSRVQPAGARAPRAAPARSGHGPAAIKVHRPTVGAFRPSTASVAVPAGTTHAQPGPGRAGLGGLHLPSIALASPSPPVLPAGPAKLLERVGASTTATLGVVAAPQAPAGEPHLPTTVSPVAATVGEAVAKTGRVVTQVTGIVVGR